MFNARFLLALGVVVSLVACSHSSSTATAQQQENQMQVKVNQPFTIELDGNPTTGYMWQIKDIPVPLKLIEQHYQKSSDCKPGMVGCGGKEIFTFQANQTGKANLVFEYGRPWEKEAGQTRTIEVNVQ